MKAVLFDLFETLVTLRSSVQMAGRLGLLAMLLRTRWPIGPNARSAM